MKNKSFTIIFTALFFKTVFAIASTKVFLDFTAPKTAVTLEQPMFTRVLTYHNRQLAKDEQLNGSEAHSNGLAFENIGDCRILVVYSLPSPAKKGDEMLKQKITYSGDMGFGYSSQSFQVHPAYILADSNFKEIPEYWYHIIMHFFPIVPMGKINESFSTQVGSQNASIHVDGIECVGNIDHIANGDFIALEILRALPQ